MPPLPPLKALQAFEAAARLKSFKAAASELHVTPAAVSQQIRGLEEMIGTALFHRLPREIALTEAGARAAPVLAEGFRRIADGATLMRASPDDRTLTVSVSPSLCSRWLVPRLHRFKAACPGIALRLDATDVNATFAGDGVDCAIRYGRGHYSGLESVLLRRDTYVPVCSPRFLDENGPFRAPGDLARRSLIHLLWSTEPEATPSWSEWLRAAGVSETSVPPGPTFSADSMALQAALDGQGVALASRLLAEDDLRHGRLVTPFPEVAPTIPRFALYLVFPAHRRDDLRVTAFLDWLREELEGAATA